MNKNLLKICCLFLINLSLTPLLSQEYERVWGTYFGPSGIEVNGGFSANGITFDSQKNMHIRGTVFYNSNLTNTYYNQFVLGNGGNYTSSGSTHNFYSTRFSPDGIPDYFGYQLNDGNNTTSVEHLTAIDGQDNKIIRYTGPLTSVINATPGTWMQTNPLSTFKNMLIKRSSTGSIIWATYLPEDNMYAISVTDDAGNIYITGVTTMQNISTPGVFQENFDVMYAQGQLIANTYLAKLNSNGQLLWATYLPSEVHNMAYYDNALYMITAKNTNPALTTMATPGTFQNTVSSSSITKIDTSNGQRTWGTYYGPSPLVSFSFLYDLAVNETGLYLVGTDFNIDGTNMFATPGAYKTQVSGGSDLFLSKFSHNGNRLWSTYFGGNGDDLNTFDKVIALNGGEIFITGTTTGSTNNIATTGSYQPTPQSSTATSSNSFFAKFNASGNLQWSSYYGGSSTTTAILKSINIKYDDHSLFLYGNTNSNTGFASEGAFMPNRIPDNSYATNGFFARFNSRQELSVNELSLDKDLVLYNNPNNGIFSISGNVLQKEDCSLSVYDTSGRFIIKKQMEKSKNQKFDMQNLLDTGNYLLKINNEKGNVLKVFKMTVKK
ncbi:T9SS type A sorting domain-containing protein [Chryseobacterium sp. C-71]|uniref:T9SS type A sorting domain-containing protein n=1 Tax=Chryseobacterium sp. C-71 TaxID=2893882 RepID=UPI001E3D5846|nr:T9SS type A sorting domain-containing protein [Chryseobacterium sp. C-71]UFH30581.1 T9SS type A sorting domain-containing protein [Chryseobacterium sp. C-71]